MAKLLRIYSILFKRIVKKPAFIIIVCLIPIFSLSVNVISKDKSGVLRVAVCLRDETDEAAEAVVNQVVEASGIILFEKMEVEQAKKQLRSGDLDAVWVVESDLVQNIQRFTDGLIEDKSLQPIITVMERESDVRLQLARVKILGILFPDFSYELYKSFVNAKYENADMDVAILDDYYEVQTMDGKIVEFRNLDFELMEDESYLVTPLKGILAVFVFALALITMLYFQQDFERGVIDYIPMKNKALLEMLYLLTSLSVSGVVVYGCLLGLGLERFALSNVINIFMFLISCGAFASLYRNLLMNTMRMSTIIPMLLLAIITFCPIFFTLRRFRLLASIWPVYYYMNGQSIRGIPVEELIYSLIVFGLAFIVRWTRSKSKI